MSLAWSFLITHRSVRSASRIKGFRRIFSQFTKCRSGWYRPKPNMAGTRNPVGRQPPAKKCSRCQKTLPRRYGELRSRQMEFAMKCPNHATFRRELGIFRAETPRTDRPTCPPKPLRRRKHLFRPLTPLFPPPVRPPALFNGLHPKSKFLAA